jgi:hypothetical protein
MTRTVVGVDKIKAFENTNYWVFAESGQFALRVGEYSDKLNQLYHATNQICGAFVTAYNPYSEQRDDATNRAAQLRLSDHLQALAPLVLDGEGKDPEGKWRGEPSLFALGLDQNAARLIGEQYRQDAIIWVDRDAVPQLILLR